MLFFGVYVLYFFTCQVCPQYIIESKTSKWQPSETNSFRPKAAPPSPSVEADGETCCRLFVTLRVRIFSAWTYDCPWFKYGYKNKTDHLSSSYHSQYNHKRVSCCKRIHQAHTLTHITSHFTRSFPLLPRGAINEGKSKFVHPVLPTFLQPLTPSRVVRSSPRMWKPILACHLLTVIHIINRKSSRWFPRALNTSGEPLNASRPFFTNEVKTFLMRAYLDGCMSCRGAFSWRNFEDVISTLWQHQHTEHPINFAGRPSFLILAF